MAKKRKTGTFRPDIVRTRKNPNDATFRNITALKKKVRLLELVTKHHLKRITKLERRLDAQPTGNESVFPLE